MMTNPDDHVVTKLPTPRLGTQWVRINHDTLMRIPDDQLSLRIALSAVLLSALTPEEKEVIAAVIRPKMDERIRNLDPDLIPAAWSTGPIRLKPTP
ncbi:MAG: hypothetical protein AB7K64_12415 [Variibacter sp.]